MYSATAKTGCAMTEKQKQGNILMAYIPRRKGDCLNKKIIEIEITKPLILTCVKKKSETQGNLLSAHRLKKPPKTLKNSETT